MKRQWKSNNLNRYIILYCSITIVLYYCSILLDVVLLCPSNLPSIKFIKYNMSKHLIKNLSKSRMIFYILYLYLIIRDQHRCISYLHRTQMASAVLIQNLEEDEVHGIIAKKSLLSLFLFIYISKDLFRRKLFSLTTSTHYLYNEDWLQGKDYWNFSFYALKMIGLVTLQ